MASRGVFFAVDDDRIADLDACADDDARRAYVEDEIEDRYFDESPDLLAETDKAWEAIQRSLNGGVLTPIASDRPLANVVLGGRNLHEAGDYVLSLKNASLVRDLASAVAGVTRESLRAGYEAIDPRGYRYLKGDEDFDYTWQWFVGVQAFWARAAERGLAVLFTVDP